MLARIVKDENDNLTWERLTSSVVGSTPLGAVYGIFSNTVPDGFLPCNGAQFDRTQYPLLYTMLGTDYLPDLRECTLVGIGENGTDTLTTHDIYTLGQFKDFSTSGSGSIKTAGYTVSGNNVTLNTTVNAANRKLVTQYVADADATDLQTLDIGGASVTRMRSKGVNYIIKAIPGNEIGDYNYVIDQMEAQLALKVSLEYVNALPTGDYIDNNIYGYQGHYYIGDHDNETLTQLANNSDLTALQPKTLDTSLTIGGSTITTVEDALAALNTVKLEEGIVDVNALPVSPNIKDLIYRYNGDIYFGDSTNQTTTLLDAEAVVWVDESDPLPTGAAIKAKLYVQPETVGSSTIYHYYVGNTTVTPHVLIEIPTGNVQPVDAVTDGDMHPVTSNAVYDRLKPKYWTTSITIGTSAWDVSISRSVDMVHVKLRCTATGTATPGTNVAFPNAPAWCRVRQFVSCVTSQDGVIDLQTNNSVTWWSSQAITQNAEWNGVCLAYDAVV